MQIAETAHSEKAEFVLKSKLRSPAYLENLEKLEDLREEQRLRRNLGLCGATGGLARWSVASLLAALKSISGARNVAQGREIHAQAILSGNDSNVFVGSSLISMYSKCGSAASARRVFDSMPFHDLVAWNSLIQCYAGNGEEILALEAFREMELTGPDAVTFAAVARACGGMASKEQGREIHGELVRIEALGRTLEAHSRAARMELDRDMVVASSLVDAYAKCGSLLDSRRAFDRMVCHDVVAWTSLLLGYADSSTAAGLTLDLFSAGLAAGWIPNSRTFVAVVKACTNLAVRDGGKNKVAALVKGRSIHLLAERYGVGRDGFLAASLVSFYAKCGSMDEAREVFETIRQPDVVVWNAVISGYAENNRGEMAYELFQRSLGSISPDGVTYAAVVNACIGMAARDDPEALQKIMEVHVQMETKLSCDLVKSSIRNSVMDCYAKCGSLEDARRVFDRMRCYSLANWTTLVMIYAENDQEELALELFDHLRARFPAAGGRAFIAGLKACSALVEREEAVRQSDSKYVKVGALAIVSEIHSRAVEHGCDTDIFVACSLINLYSRCRSLAEARKVFEKVAEPDVAAWNAMISGCSDNDQGDLALDYFSRMSSTSCEPDAGTLCAALESCSVLAENETGSGSSKFAKVAALDKGMELHSRVRQRMREEDDIVLSSALIGMYSKCGSLLDAIGVFEKMQQHDVVSWTSIILGCVENGEAEMALRYFRWMDSASCKPDSRVFVAALNACRCVLAGIKEQSLKVEKKSEIVEEMLETGMAIHFQARKNKLDLDTLLSTALVEFYSTAGSMIDARAVFDKMPHRSSSSWTSLLLGYVGCGEAELALELFQSTNKDCLNSLGFVAALKACGVTVSLHTAKAIHGEISRRELLEENELLATTQLDVYGKCSSMVDAQRVFDSVAAARDDPVTWSALIAGYSRGGDTQEVLRVFYEMENEFVLASSSSLLCFLTACSHAGLVERGVRCFEAMASKFGIDPSLEHYSAMVDLYGRANRLDAAVRLIEEMMPLEASAGMWRTVLGACWKWKNAKVARVAYDALVRMDEADAGTHVTMANLCLLGDV